MIHQWIENSCRFIDPSLDVEKTVILEEIVIYCLVE